MLKVRMAGDNSGKDGKEKGKGKGKGKDKDKGKGKNKGNKALEVAITGLPFKATADVLRKDFSECGEIVRLVLPLTDEGNAKGNAYIEFSDKAGCDKALEFDETEYGGRWIKV